METVVKSLSTLNSKPWKSNMDNVSYKQIQRYYPGGYYFNFPLALSGFNDFKTKQYSNLYLTNNIHAQSFIDADDSTMEITKLFTSIKSGNSYLSIVIENGNTIYDSGMTFKDSLDETCYFDISFYEDDLCTIIYNTSGRKYILYVNDDLSLTFKWTLNVPSTIEKENAYSFKYVYNSASNQIVFIKDTSGVNRLLKKTDDELTLVELNYSNKNLLISNFFTVERPKKYDINFNANTSFVTYENNSNKLNGVLSEFNLRNNFLIHSPYVSEYKDVIILKNQLSLNETFTNSNNLLSSGYDIAVDGFRNYTNITTPIDSEESSEINLNYVFYNKPYLIRKGKTEFQSPSSIYPFSELNINDSKIIKSGAFSYVTPVYADKIYQVDMDNYSNDGYVYLCTWLSGSPMSDSKIWVDRYYYPDLITKRDALLGKGVFDITYNEFIETLTSKNSQLSSTIQQTKIFDKRSDLTFIPNQKYIYSRFENELSAVAPLNCAFLGTSYQTDINDAGKITLSFYFAGGNTDWVIRSLRNNIDSGITITKSGTSLSFEYKLYDNSSETTYVYQTTTDYKLYKDNYVCFTFDSFTGKGFFYMNNSKILDITTQVGQFSNKRLLYGRFYYNDQDLLLTNNEISDVIISNDSIDENLAFVIPFVQNRKKIDDITITLPCGMRNSIDDISYLHSICNTNSNKSNYINISIDNLGIDNPEILRELENTVVDKIKTHLPITTNINKVTFTDYI